MDYETGKNFEKIFAELELMEERFKEIEKKIGLKRTEVKNEEEKST